MSASLDSSGVDSMVAVASQREPREHGRSFSVHLSAVIPLLCVPILLYLVVFPLASLLLGSFQEQLGRGQVAYTVNNYVRAYTNIRTYTTLGTSLVFVFGVCAVTLLLTLPFAWIVERTNTPLRKYFYAVGVVPLIVPGVISTMAWIFLLDADIGWINMTLRSVFGLAQSPFDITSLPGMIWIQALHSSPLAFLLISAALKSMDPTLEESAAASGASQGQILRRVVFPLILPAIAAVLILVAVRGFEAFDVPLMIGMPSRIFVLSSEIYFAFSSFPPDFGTGTALAVGLLAIAATGVWLYGRATRHAERFGTVTGKAFRPRQIDLGRWRFLTLAYLLSYAILLIGLPAIVLVWASLLPFFEIPKPELFKDLSLANYAYIAGNAPIRRAVINSLVAGLACATLVMILTAVLAWIIVRTNLTGRRALDYLSFLPIGIPGVVLGVALIQMYANIPIGIYGTLTVIVLAYLTNFLPYGMRTSSLSMIQIHRELEEAAKMSGASWLGTFRRVLFPLLKPGLLSGWVYIFVASFRELSAPLMLSSKDSQVISVLVYDLYNGGKATTAVALGIVLIVALLLIITIVTRLGARFGIQE